MESPLGIWFCRPSGTGPEPPADNPGLTSSATICRPSGTENTGPTSWATFWGLSETKPNLLSLRKSAKEEWQMPNSP